MPLAIRRSCSVRRAPARPLPLRSGCERGTRRDRGHRREHRRCGRARALRDRRARTPQAPRRSAVGRRDRATRRAPEPFGSTAPKRYHSSALNRRALFRLGLRVSGIDEIQNSHCFREHCIVVPGLLLDSLQHGFQALRVGNRDAADVEKVHGSADRGEARVVVKAEAREENLECDAVVDVREFGTVEIEAYGLARAVARTVDPYELGIAIDESLDEPRAGEAIHPQILARCPYPLLIPSWIDLSQSLPGRMRFAARICFLKALFEGGERVGGLELRLAREEIDARQLVE